MVGSPMCVREVLSQKFARGVLWEVGWGVVLVFLVGPLPIGSGVQGVLVLVGFQAMLEYLGTPVYLVWYWIVGGRPRWLVDLFHGLV